MKIRIIGINGSDKHSGIYGSDGEIAPGTEAELKDEPPAAWAGKFEVIEKGPAKGSVAVNNSEGKGKA